jgi:hypothetical protein
VFGEGWLAYVQHIGSLGYIQMFRYRCKRGELRECHVTLLGDNGVILNGRGYYDTYAKGCKQI